MEIKTFEYVEGGRKVEVPFKGDTTAYINATATYKAFGKSKTAFNNWKQGKLTTYAERLVKFVGPQKMDLEQLIDVKGDTYPVQERGTWLHPKLAIMFARWLSMDFEIWCDEKIEFLLKNEFVGIDDETTEMLRPFNTLIVKAVKSNKHSSKTFNTNVIALLASLEKAGAGYKAYKAVVARIRRDSKEDSLVTYNKTSKAVVDAYESGAISRRSLEDINGIIHAREVQVLKNRKSRTEQELEVQNSKLLELELQFTKAKESAAKVGTKLSDAVEQDYKKEITKLKKSLKLYIDAENNCPITVTFDRSVTPSIIAAKFRNDCIATQGVTVVSACHLLKLDNAGRPSKNGKFTIPNWSIDKVGHMNMYEIALWENTHSIGMRFDKYGSGKVFNTALEVNLEDQNIYTGFFATNAAVRYYMFFDVVTKLMLMCRHEIKYNK